MSDWERVEQRFTDAVALTGAARDEFLERTCAGDPELRSELESLLREHDSAGGILDSPLHTTDPSRTSERLSELTPPSVPIPSGTPLGPWQVGELIGRGGSGEVYSARRADGAFEQRVAIKVLRPEAAAHLERFHAERRLLARLEHPRIARLLDGGVTPDGRPYAVIEYVNGLTLVEHCQLKNHDLEQRLRLFAQVCEAVAYAHRHLIVHRDLKPGNILVRPDGTVKLLDFGIAKRLDQDGDPNDGNLTRSPMTLDYAAPEQLTGAAVTTATDVYALGVLLFELLTGTRPWRSAELPIAHAVRLLLDEPAPAASTTARSLPSAPIPWLRLTGDLDAIVAKCLRKEPAHRYDSVEALGQDLERHLELRPVKARENARLYVWGRLLRRHRWSFAAGFALFLSLAAGLAGFAWQAHRIALERDVARRAASREEAVRNQITHLFRSSLAEKSPEPLTAKTMLDRSAQRVLKEYRDDPALAGKVVETLADLYGALQDVEGQVPLLEAFLAAAGSEADPQAVAVARQKLAHLELLRGNPERATRLLDQAQAFWQQDPTRHLEQRIEGNAVRGTLQRARGDLEGSIATFEATLRDRIALSGRVHRETANLYNSLAISLTGVSRYDEALTAYRQAITILRQLGQGEDLDAQVMLGNTGTLAFRVGRTREAQEILETSFQKQRTLAGDSAAVAASMGLFGAALTQRGEAARAVPFLREALHMAVEFSGADSPLAVQDRQYLTDALATSGEAPEARRLLAQNLGITRKKYGDRHLLTLRLHLARARMDLDAGKLAEAQNQVVAVVPTLRELGPSAETWLAHAQVLAGEVLLALARPQEALAPLQEATALREKLLWSGSWELAQARARWGEALLQVRDSKGRALLESAEKALAAELTPDHPETVRTRSALAVARR